MLSSVPWVSLLLYPHSAVLIAIIYNIDTGENSVRVPQEVTYEMASAHQRNTCTSVCICICSYIFYDS